MNSLEILKKHCEKYIADDQYVYKKCSDMTILDKSRRWLVVMRKTKDTLTNEKRPNCFLPQNAKHRASILEVVEIIDVNDPLHTKCRITNEYRDAKDLSDVKRTTYRVKECVKPDHYDQNILEVCSGGIHYFKSIDRAFAYETIPESFCGQLPEHGDDGSGVNLYSYENGVLHGPATIWHKPSEEGKGLVFAKFGHLDGERNGKYEEWYENGKQKREGNYQNGYPCDQWTHWYSNGNKRSCGNYAGEPLAPIRWFKDGKWTFWYENGNKSSEGEYLNGYEHGLWTTWHENGVKSSEGSYSKRHGKIYFNSNLGPDRCNDNSDRCGEWTDWHICGQKSEEGEYVDGNRSGEHLTWHSNGQLASKTLWDGGNGEEIGRGEKWDINGKKISKRKR